MQPAAHPSLAAVYGYITNLNLHCGDYARIGEAKMAVVDVNSFWVLKNVLLHTQTNTKLIAPRFAFGDKVDWLSGRPVITTMEKA